MKLLKVYQYQHHQILGILCPSYIYIKKNISLSGFSLCQSTPFHTTNILLLSTRILSKSNDPSFFKVSIISKNFSIRRAFYFIFDKAGYCYWFLLQLFLVHCFLLKHIFGSIFPVFFHVFSMFFVCLLQTYFEDILMLNFLTFFPFCLSLSDLF